MTQNKREPRFESRLDAVRCITRNGGNVADKVISRVKPGLKVLSAIDYLVNYHRHVWLQVDGN